MSVSEMCLAGDTGGFPGDGVLVRRAREHVGKLIETRLIQEDCSAASASGGEVVAAGSMCSLRRPV